MRILGDFFCFPVNDSKTIKYIEKPKPSFVENIMVGLLWTCQVDRTKIVEEYTFCMTESRFSGIVWYSDNVNRRNNGFSTLQATLF